MTFTKSYYVNKVWNPRDVYIAYATKLLEQHPEYWSKYSKSRRMRHFWIFTKVNNKVVEIINFDRWKKIMHAYFAAARQCIIDGKSLNLGNYIGRIEARRVERNHNNPQVDFAATAKQPKVMGPDGKLRAEKVVYFVDDEWIRIAWVKTSHIPNEKIYRFCPTEGDKKKEGFKDQFSKANRANPDLKLAYRYYSYGIK